jgi:hypothetical protein
MLELFGMGVPPVGTEEHWLVIGKVAPAAFQLGAKLASAVRQAGAFVSVSDALAITAYLAELEGLHQLAGMLLST